MGDSKRDRTDRSNSEPVAVAGEHAFLRDLVSVSKSSPKWKSKLFSNFSA